MRTYKERFIWAIEMLIGTNAIPDELVDAWINHEEPAYDLQNWLGSYTPSWLQNIAILDAAHEIASQPIEGDDSVVDYEDLDNYM